MDIEITLKKTELSYPAVMEVLNSMPQFDFSISEYNLEGSKGTFVIHSDCDLPEMAVSYPLLDCFYKADFAAILYQAMDFEETVALNRSMVNLALGGYSHFCEKNKILDLAVKVLLGSKVEAPNNLQEDWFYLRSLLHKHADKRMLESLEGNE